MSKPQFRSKKTHPVQRFFARASHEFKAARGGMETPFQHFLAHVESLFIDHTAISLINPNRHRVSNNMWRSSQIYPSQVSDLKKLGIKTIVNLRGCRDCASYHLEKEACEKAGVKLVDFPVNSRQPPTRDVLEKLQSLFSSIEYPALMHCKAGADRVGLMSVLYLLIHEKRPIAEAREQLSLRFGHMRYAKTGVLDHFLDEYQNFVTQQPIDFMDWAMTHYNREAVIKGYTPIPLAEWFYTNVLGRE